MKTINKAFTFVELIVSVWIILLISTIWYISYTGNLETKDNAKMIADLATIDNSFKLYFAEIKTLPEASGNKSFYKADWTYAHDETDWAYWVSSFVSEKTFASKYLNSVPLDPRTGYYYAYGKTIDNKYYEIAGVEKQDNNYKSVVVGNYKTTWDELINLVREYNWPEFVWDNSSSHFPYNPEEKVLTASIYDYTGSVTVTRWTQSFTWNSILDISLVAGDKIVATANSTASIYFSDWSKSYLWDVNSTSELNLSEMSYKENSNLFTKVKLVLNIWTLWTSASKMSENSDFEVYSNNTVAAVRWTIFWVSVDSAKNTNVVVIRWVVEVDKINTDWTIVPLSNIPWITDASGIITVNQNEASKWLQVSTTWTPTSSTWAINEIPGTPTEKDSILIWWIEGNEEIVNLEIEELTNSTANYSDFKAKIKIEDKLLAKFDYFKLNWTNTETFKNLWINSATWYIITAWTKFSNTAVSQILTSSTWKFDLVACTLTKKWEKCSKSKKFTVWEKVSYNEQETVATTPITASIYDTTIPLRVIFGTETIDNTLATSSYNLVWYAGYNLQNDLNLYWLQSIIIDDWHDNNALEDNNDKYVQYDSTLNIFKTTSADYTISNSGLPSFVSRYNWKAIYKWGTYGNWVFVDNFNSPNGSPDHLKYNIWDLNLTSWSWFAIEMSVRGAALKRNSLWYVLFDIPWVSWWDWLRLSTYNNEWLYLWKHTTSNNQIISYTSLSSIITDLNKFYKVIVTYNWLSNMKIFIYDWTNKIWESTLYTWWNSTISVNIWNINNIYIWSYYTNTTYIWQWNDIIDYVKIYGK